MAFVISIISGLAVHGIGNLYVEENATGIALFFAEGFSIFLMSGQISNSDYNNSDLLKDAGAILFTGSWIADFISAPITAVKKNNEYRRIINKSSFRSDDNNVMGISISWNIPSSLSNKHK